MNQRVLRQESKEFQMKVLWPEILGEVRSRPEVTDRLIFARVCETIVAAVDRIADGTKTSFRFNDNLWRREGIRYDTATGALGRQYLTLAIEATDERTKLKAKQHSFIPELLFTKPKQAICYPAIKKSGGYALHDSKLKLEQDLHFSNLKYCASGSLFLEGRTKTVNTLGSFSRYFPALNRLQPAETPLHAVSHWDEAVFDDLSVRWHDTTISTWMLVNRWNWASDRLLESELSFKVAKTLKDPWDMTALQRATQLYLALQQSGRFMPAPPIFFFDHPVTAVAIEVGK